MFCARCGKPLPEAAGFCPNCGAPVAAATAAFVPPAHVATAYGATGSTATPAAETMAGPPPGMAPPAAAVAVHYGGFWRRVVAFIVDGLIIGAVMLPFGIGLGLAHMMTLFHEEEMTGEMFASMLAASMMVWLIRVLVSWIYGAGFESSRFQATPGKMLLALKVTDLNGGRISFARATGRQVGKWVSGIILGIGYLLVAFSDRKQGLHDMMAGTLVRRS